MKLNLIKVKDILLILERSYGHETNTTVANRLVSSLKPSEVYCYLKLLKEIRAIECLDPSLGFKVSQYDVAIESEQVIEITFLGRQILECLANPNLVNKLTGGAREVGYNRLSTIPTLAIQAMFNEMGR